MSNKFCCILGTVLILGFVLSFSQVSTAGDNDKQKHSDVDFSISCAECHSEATPELTKQWQESKHGLMNFGCYMCHGDGEEEFSPKPSTESCIGCHADQTINEENAQVTNCYDCHKGHSLKYHE